MYGNNGTAVTGSPVNIYSAAALTVNYANGVQSSMTTLTGGGTLNFQGSGPTTRSMPAAPRSTLP